MDMTFEATCAVAEAQMTTTVIKAVFNVVTRALEFIAQVASVSCPSLGGTSLSAVSPDNYFGKEIALGIYA